MPLTESIAVLAATTPPGLSKKQALAEVNARIIMLQHKLGISPGLMPILNPAKAIARLTQLESQLAAKGLTPPPAPAPSALAVAAPVVAAAVAAASGQPEILTATLAEFRKMDAQTRLNFSHDHGALSHADFSALSPAAKMEHCRNGGQVLAADRRHRNTAAASFNS
jgi:hypothetical protein